MKREDLRLYAVTDRSWLGEESLCSQVVQRDCMVRVSREGEQIFEGKLGSLKRFKDDVKEVKSNFECGLVIEDFNDVQEMDIIEGYIMVEVPR